MAFIGNTNTTQAFTPAIDYFSGNASTTAFTLSRPVASVAQVQVVVNNVAQNPSSAYTISSSTITFTSAPTSGTNNIYVYYTSPITQVIAPGQGTVTSDSFGTITNFTTTGNTILGDATSDTLTVGVTGIVKDASGNVGIGTASPAYKLDVQGGISSFTNSSAEAVRISKVSAIVNSNEASRNLVLYSTDSYAADLGPQMSFGGATNGGTTPYAFATIAGRKEGATSYAGYLQFSTTTGTSAVITERMRIDSSGNLLVGTTVTPTGATGGAGFIAESSSRKTLLVASTSTSAIALAAFINPNGTVGTIQTSGTATSYVTSSDYRLKNTITPMTGALAKVTLLKPCTYKWNVDGSDGQGFIAHELQAVIPECVTETKDATDADGNPVYQGIDTSFLVATLTAAIQEQQALITALTARITALENK